MQYAIQGIVHSIELEAFNEGLEIEQHVKGLNVVNENEVSDMVGMEDSPE